MPESLSLKCESKGGKPAPKLRWYRNSLLLSDESATSSEKNESDKRQTVVSTLKLTPTSDDNNAHYLCETQTAFPSDKMATSVTLNVLYAPGRPVVEGYRTREKIRAGDTVNLKCSSRGGNPLPRLVWTKDGSYVDHSYMSSTPDFEAVNEIIFVATPSDDGALYTCSASSIMTPEPMRKAVKLKVLYAPASVTINAPKEAKSGDLISAICRTERSNPAAEVTWVVDGIPIEGEGTVEEQATGGWVTTSTIQVNVTQQDRNSKLFNCYAINQELGDTITEMFTVSILYPPDPPNIFGYVDGNAIHAGKLQRLTCISHGGNPLPQLQWYKGTKEVSSSKQSSSGNIISRELAIVVDASDNGAQYQCRSTSKALEEPLVAALNLTVYFPPLKLNMKVKPKKPKAESEIRLTCESGSSNPASNITWWKGHQQLTPVSTSVSSTGEYGGSVTKGVVYINVTAEDDGSQCTCQATNEAIQQSIHDTIILSVFYKPIFSSKAPKTFQVEENESCVFNLTAEANPDEVIYEWKRGDEVVQEGPVLNITTATRAQSGEYILKATNEIGETTTSVVFRVLYPPKILRGEGEREEKVVIAEPEANVRLECAADACPLPSTLIQWKREDLDFRERAEVLSITEGKSVLSIKNVSRDISGEFLCVADNGIGTSDSWKIVLLIKHEPIITSLENVTVLSDRGVSAKLQCIAEGVPQISFTWTFEGVVVSAGTWHISSELIKLNHVTWQSVLTLNHINASNFGEYKCVARNEIGFDTVEISLVPDSAPDPPVIVRVTNTTKTSLFIIWVPGFDGGHNQTHRIRYKHVKQPTFTYVDVHPPNATSMWIRGLRSALQYEVAIKSINSRGSSLYTTAIVKAFTLDPSHGLPKGPADGSDLGTSLMELLVATIGTVFFLLLAFNIVLLALYYNKKEPRLRRRDLDVSSSSDVSATSKVVSDETTFSSVTDYSTESLKDKTTDSISVHYSESNSEESSAETSSDEMETSQTTPSTRPHYGPRQTASQFI